jgi:hypothetical protein
MDTTENLQQQLTEVFETFIAEFSTISTQRINAEPKVGSWTIGQLGQHVVLATIGIGDEKNKSTDRPADQFEQSIRETFLDYTQKFKSPEFIVPEKREYKKEELLTQLKNNEEELINIVKEKKLDHLCLDIELPGWGNLTRYEWIKLIIYHVQRHTQQLKKLKQSFDTAVQMN